MQEQNLTTLVAAIPDNQQATITLTDPAGGRKSYECTFKQSEPPQFNVVFSPENIPGEVDMQRPCPFNTIDEFGTVTSFAAGIVQRRGTRVFEMEASKAISLESLREFFRVNIRTPIAIRFEPEPGSGYERWEMEGETVDISQSGLLAILPGQCIPGDPLLLELELPNPDHLVVCLAHVVRKRKMRKDKWLIAFQFDRIDSRTRDIIAKNCFAEQRRQLRENIRIDN